MDQEVIETAKKVIAIEIEGLQGLEQSINHSFLKVVTLCSECSGKIVITGMGKSGHIAGKISATLASLGTPSFFLHPAEAAHGDLGMVQEKDLVIMISSSGETDELLRLIPAFRRIGCRMISMVCRRNSTMAGYSDAEWHIPIKREACIHNIAPTASTTALLAAGDALAVALSKWKGFEKEDFAVFHPSGNLGKRLLMTVEDAAGGMEDVVIEKGSTIRKALFKITRNHYGAVCIVGNDGRLQGLVTDGDIRRSLEKNEFSLDRSVDEITSKNPKTLKNDLLAADAFKFMSEHKLSVAPVIFEDGKAAGMISLHDILKTGIIRYEEKQV